MVKIAPSILSADFGKLEQEIKKLEKHVDMFHIDVMDGHFVPNITFGPPVLECVRKITDSFLDAHLMIEHPEKYADAFAEAGADSISVHLEAKGNVREALGKIRDRKVRSSIALNPDTPLASAEKYLDSVDMVLLMTVNPGFGGQKFIESVLPKISELKSIREKRNLSFEIQVDGGINEDTARLSVKAGADILVAGSYIYKSGNFSEAIEGMRK